MGIDACIYVRTKDGAEPALRDSLPEGAAIIDAGEWAQEGATHEIDQAWRYYGPNYERGPWPHIAAVLMALHASENVETVWYFGDYSGGDAPFTPERVLEYSAQYMRRGGALTGSGALEEASPKE